MIDQVIYKEKLYKLKLADINLKLMPPDTGNERTEYSYINYYDTSNARSSQPREPDTSLVPSRGILKNKKVNFIKATLSYYIKHVMSV